MTPEALDFTDVRYLHVFKCAECTQELIDLRRTRAAGLARADAESECPSPLNEPFAVHRRRSWLTAFFGALAAFAAAVKRRFLSLKARLTRE